MTDIFNKVKKNIVDGYVLTYPSDNPILKNINNKLFDLMTYLYSIDVKIIDNYVDSDAETIPVTDSDNCNSDNSDSDNSNILSSSDTISNKRNNCDSDNEYYDSDDEPLIKKIKYNYDYLLNDLFEKELNKVMAFTNIMCLIRIFFNNQYLYIISPTNNIKDKIISLNEHYDCKGRIIVIGIYKNNDFNPPDRKYKGSRGFYNIDHNIVESLKINDVLFESNKYIIDTENKEFWKDKRNKILLDKNENENNMWNYFYK